MLNNIYHTPKYPVLTHYFRKKFIKMAIKKLINALLTFFALYFILSCIKIEFPEHVIYRDKPKDTTGVDINLSIYIDTTWDGETHITF